MLQGFLGGAKGVAYRSQLQALVVLHLKNNAFARRQALHRGGDARFDFLANEGALAIQRGPVLALAFEKIRDAFLVVRGIQFRRLIFRTRLSAAQVIQADVGDDAVEPGVKAALETKTMEIAVNLEESFLVDLPGVLGALHNIKPHTHAVPTMPTQHFLEIR